VLVVSAVSRSVRATEIRLRYWEWTPEDDVRPRIHLLSD
jgi:hypothetical protein